MKCDRKIADLLPWYVAETLSEEERQEVEAHVRVCPKCQKSLLELQWFAAGMERYAMSTAGQHIAPEKLVLYAESKSELTAFEISRIEQHLEQCSDCREELDILLKVNNDLLKKASALSCLKRFFKKSLFQRMHRSLSSPGTVSKRFRAQPALRPLFAYLVVLVLLYPAYRGIRSMIYERKLIGDMRSQISELEMEHQLANRKIALFEESSEIGVYTLERRISYRGSSEREEEVRIISSAAILRLFFEPPVWEEACQYDVDLYFEDRLVSSQENIAPPDDRGYLSIAQDARALVSGHYELRLTQRYPDGSKQSRQFHYTFEFTKE